MIFTQNRARKGNSLKQKNLLKSLTTMNCCPVVALLGPEQNPVVSYEDIKRLLTTCCDTFPPNIHQYSDFSESVVRTHLFCSGEMHRKASIRFGSETKAFFSTNQHVAPPIEKFD